MAHVYAAEVHRIVDDAIEKAIGRIASDTSLKLKANDRDSEAVISDEIYVPNIKWINIEDFSVEDGLLKIEEFLKTWKRDESWLHCIDFLKEEDLPYSKRYRFEVKWSIPTRRKPIPRATASTYFTVDVSKVKPKDYPVEVYYVFEGHRLVHRPGQSRFNEKWLKDIIESKIHLMSSITF